MTILASRGVVSLIILLLPNYTELKDFLWASSNAESDKLAEKIVQEEANQNPHLNIALRAEIIYFTTQVSLRDHHFSYIIFTTVIGDSACSCIC